MLKLEIQKFLISGIFAFIASAGVGNAAHNSQDKAISTIANHVQNDATPLATEGTDSIGNEAVAKLEVVAINPYLEPVDIPPYNVDDPTHVLITPDNGKWTASVLNDPSYQHFYVAPGKYATQIRLTASGTSDNRRTLSLYNGDDKHPAALPDSQVADVRFYFVGASYWTIDRMAILDTQLAYVTVFRSSSTHNIINRLHARNYIYGINIYPFNHYNTIQNSYMNHMSHGGRMSDDVAIAIHTNGEPNTIIEGTKVINNDIRNANDGIQLVVSSPISNENVSYPNTILDSNHIWMDGDVYTNGDYATNGYNENGQYQIGEQAIDLKVGSRDASKPVVISNNILWGYQKSDSTAGGSFSVLKGTAIVFSRDCTNVKIDKNIIFDTQRGLHINSTGTKDIDITNNIFYKMNRINPDDDKTYASFVYKSTDVLIANNTYVDVPTNSQGHGVFFNFYQTSDSRFVKNVAISSHGTSRSLGNVVDGNYYYDSTEYFNGTNEHHFSTASEAKMTDYTFTYERFTASPKQKILNYIIATEDSPHYRQAGSIIGLELLFKSGFEN